MPVEELKESVAELLDEPAEQETAPAQESPEQAETPPEEQSKKRVRKKGKAKEEPPAAEQAAEEEREETPDERARRMCYELTALCRALSEQASGYAQGDIEFESLVSTLQAATTEYDELSVRLKRKRKTGELTRRSKRRLRRSGKDVKRRREDLNAYLYYHDINLLLLESPQSYACMLCQNRQLIETEDGDQVCRLRLELGEEQTAEPTEK